jgi:hypothetical protein
LIRGQLDCDNRRISNPGSSATFLAVAGFSGLVKTK